MATKAKKRNKGKSKADLQAAGVFAVGDRVRVLSGDYGNARGEVKSISGGTVVVRLDADAHKPETAVHEFELSNVAPAVGHFDR